MTAPVVIAGIAAVLGALALTDLAAWLRQRLPTDGAARGARLAAGPVGPLLAAGLLGLLVGGPLVGGAVAVGCLPAMRLLRAHGEARRRRALDASVAQAARTIADALRGGASIRTALAAAGRDASVPAVGRSELTIASGRIAAGATLADALGGLARAGGAATALCAATIALRSESGGRLAAELERLAADVALARRLDDEHASATAGARATVRVVAALPLLALAAAELLSRGFLASVAREPLALALLALGLVLELVAVVLARAIVTGVRP